ncbi:MAG: ATP synthase F0 subunit B [Oscillospiraceae bacterium]|nr:ATP synthase F0 subunit B [Oscillospiraceae bacterium]
MPLNIDWQQILLHLFNFVILAGGLYFILYKPVKSFMRKREENYAAREARTQQLNDEAAALRKKYETKLHQAEEQIQKDRERHHEELEEERQRLIDDAKEQARAIINTASQTAELRSRKAIDDAHEEIRAMAVNMVEKLVLSSGGDALDQFLDEAESERDNG